MNPPIRNGNNALTGIYRNIPIAFKKTSKIRNFKVKRAIISDIHANLEALQAVMEDIEKQNVNEIICLGDVIGYGANPLECLDIVIQKCQKCLLGNHEQGAFFDPEGFNGSAARAIFWTREQLQAPSERRDERWEFINMNPRKYYLEDWKALFVHGSPRNPLNEYVFSDEVYEGSKKIEMLFNIITHVCFQGHTHIPGVFTQDHRFLSPDEINYELDLQPDLKYMINVGSVGQSRDGIAKACYVTVEEKENCVLHLVYHRVEYSNQTAAEKIYQISAIDQFQGDRLLSGR